ncbi:MAG: RHS repeat-associated core domain-containing protein, partial [Bryobacteraceae bacterium]
QTVTKVFAPLSAGATAVYTSSGLSYYRHPDWLGSSRIASTPSRTLYYDGAYAPFGENYAETGTTDRNFTGQNQDLTPGATAPLYDFLYREEHSTQGRWISPDPAGVNAVDPSDPQSWNEYAYGLNGPCTSTDPLGLAPCSFNIGVTDATGQMSQVQMSTLEKTLAGIFAAGGVGLGVNFAFAGPADFNLVISNISPIMVNMGSDSFSYSQISGALGVAPFTPGGDAVGNVGYIFPGLTTAAYGLYNPSQLAVALGRSGAHEAGHYLLQLAGHSTSGLMQAAANITQPQYFQPNQGIWLQTTCSKLHPPVAGGGGGASTDPLGGGSYLSWWYQIGGIVGWLNSIPVESVTSTITFN